MRLNSFQVVHGCPAFILRRPSRPRRFARPTSASASSAELAPVESPLLESSVIPVRFPELHPEKPAFTVDPPLAYEVLQGSLVRHCNIVSERPPTIVLIHGILGSKRNLRAFAKRLLEGYPCWQAVLVDLRCHGDSKGTSFEDHHTVESAANDILQLLNFLKVFPRVLIGHSFGGKVVLSMAEQFGQTLPRPVQAWVLDALPGEVSAPQAGSQDHPFKLIQTLKQMPLPIRTRTHLVGYLTSRGFSSGIAHWMTTNLRQTSNGFEWIFDLNGIESLYRSYETSSLWSVLERPPEGLKIDFVRAERSHFRWNDVLQNRIEDLGHRVHLLKDAGHWVHADNPEGLFHLLQSSFGSSAFGSALPSLCQ